MWRHGSKGLLTLRKRPARVLHPKLRGNCVRMPTLRNSFRYCVATLFAASLAWPEAPAPGAVNYVEGRVSLDGKPLDSTPESRAVQTGHVLQTENGRAEVLLTPGVFIRLGQNSALRMVSATPSVTRVELLRGELLAEVIELPNHGRLEVVDGEAYTQLVQAGIYEFRADHRAILVYRGKARIKDDARGLTLGAGQEIQPDPNSALHRSKFDRTETDGLYSWSAQRATDAAYCSEATAYNLLALDFGAKYDDGWYWNPWFQSWAYVPSTGFRLSPFGYGLYAPNRTQNRAPLFASFRQ